MSDAADETNRDPNGMGAFPIEHLPTQEEKKANLLHGIVTAIAVTLVLFIFIGALLPSTVRVERKTIIDAPIGNIYAVLNGYTRFNEWSPWHAMDPDTQYTFNGPLWGKGASMSWSGKKSGQGTQTITASVPGKRVRTDLNFGGSMAVSQFDLQQDPKGIEVTWSFETDFGWNLIGRYVGMTFDGSIGKDYENGLARLKTLVEALPKDDVDMVDISFVDAPAQSVAYVSGSTTTDPAAIAAAFTQAYARIGAYMAANRLEMAGPPLSIAEAWDEAADRYAFKAAIPYKGAPMGKTVGDVSTMTTTAGPALRAVHVGSYDSLKPTYEALEAFLVLTGLKATGGPWEEYVSDPGKTPTDELVTNVYFPVARR